MGHVRLGALPKTRGWQNVVELLAGGTDVATLADATSRVARAGLEVAKKDPGVIQSLLALAQLASSGKEDDVATSLRRHGIAIEGSPSLLAVTCALSAALDGRVQAHRTDVGEMAILAAVESVSHVVGAHLPSLFDATPADVRSALRGLSTERTFGVLVRTFFARFTARYLSYYLSRETSAHVGRGQRFATLDDHSQFNAALRLHCHEASRIVENFAGEWFSKARWQKDVSNRQTRAFSAVAFKKLAAELSKREGPTGGR